MNKREYKQNAYYVMYLIRCALGGKVPAKNKLDKMDLSGVFAVAKGHLLAALVAYALESAGIFDKDFEEEKFKSIRKNIILDTDRANVTAELEKAGIWYMPLKGSITKELYPQLGMRQMADNDILFDMSRALDVKNIMLSLGFTNETFDKGGHDVYFKQPVSNFEMHTRLFSRSFDETLFEYYSRVTERMMPADDCNFGKKLSREDFYIYITAHEYKHYTNAGTGLRGLVDTYVYLSKYCDELDMEYIARECEKLGIAEFERKNRELALHLLGGRKLTKSESEMVDYFIFSGTYGNVSNRVNNKIKRDYSGRLAKVRYLFSRIAVPVSAKNPNYAIFSETYRWFYKNRIRLPLLFFYRLGKAVSTKRTKAKSELGAVLKSREK